MKTVLTAIDVTGIQSYVFASNRLRDVIGASRLVEWASSREKVLNVPGAPSPEIVMAAGGNAILRFDNREQARAFVLRYSRLLLDKAPGLDVAVAHQDQRKGALAKDLVALQIRLAQAKLKRRAHAPQLGLGVLQNCAVTGLPAAEYHPRYEGQYLSARIARVRDDATIDQAKARWNKFLPLSTDRTFEFPDEIDQMGRTFGDTSMIGIVHIDGNGIGNRIQRWLGSHLERNDDEAVREEYREWSTALYELGTKVMGSVTKRVAAAVKKPPTDGHSWRIAGLPDHLSFDLLKMDEDQRAVFLPIRPILLGGDDLTFVCDGRIALDLAATALETFETESTADQRLRLLGERPLTACTGVAIVKSHAPFSRGYELCEALCANAKHAKKAADLAGRETGSWLDWHIGASRPGESPKEIRKRHYDGGRLTCRPYPLHGDALHPMNWYRLDRDLLGDPKNACTASLSFRAPNVWSERRSKVKALANLVCERGDAVRKAIQGWKNVTPNIGLPAPLDGNGFAGDRTPLLDAIELLDIHMKLDSPVTWAENFEAVSSHGEAGK